MKIVPDLSTFEPIRGTTERAPNGGPRDHLADALFGRTRQLALSWLLGRPDQAFYLRELVRLTGAGQGALQRELHVLTRAGIIQRTIRGRQVYFQADRGCPIFEELRSVLAKTAGLGDVLRNALAPLTDRIRVAFVFGSMVRGETRSSSDVDLLVVGDVSFGDVVDAIGPAQTRLARELNPSVYRPREFADKVRAGHHFVNAILKGPKLFILGGPDELERLAAVRLGDPARVHAPRDARPARRRRARPARQRK